METKRLISVMLLSFVVIFGWQLLVYRVWGPPKPKTATTQSVVAPTTGASPATNSLATTQATIATTGVAATSQPSQMTSSAVRVMSAATQPVTVTLGENSKFPLLVKLSSTGAGLESVRLKGFAAEDRKSQYVYQEPSDLLNSATRAMATRTITVNGTPVETASVQWNVEKQDEHSAVFSLDLGAVKVRKIYELTDDTAPGQGFELTQRYEIVNSGAAAATVKIAANGAITPPHENEQGKDVQIISAYDDGYQAVKVVHHIAEEFDEKKTTVDLTKAAGDGKPILWFGTASVYFNAITRPIPFGGGAKSAQYIDNVNAECLNPLAKPMDRHVIVTYTTSDLLISPNDSTTLTSSMYLGPRWRKVLEQPYYTTFPLSYDQSLVLTSGPCAICTFQFLIIGLVKLLAFFHAIFRDWGLAIITLVVIVRACLHPITKRSQVSMMRMGKMGPEIERLKKKYADDKDELNRQMMAMYKEQGVGAYLGCLPMFLQMPIWIALWSALNTTFELRHAPFLQFGSVHLTWISDLAKPDRLISWAPVHFWLPLIGEVTLSSFNLLPALLAVVFYLQQEFTPKPPATTPEQESQQKMMKWMSLLFPIFLYKGPSGLNLYILTSTTIGIIESKRIRDHIKQKEEEEKAGKIIVDAPAGMKKKRDEGGPGTVARTGGTKPAPKGGLAGWLEQIKQRAEDIQREQNKSKKK